MSDIENDPVSLRNGTRVQRIRPYKLKQFVSFGARLRHALEKLMANSDAALGGKNGAAPDSGFRSVDLAVTRLSYSP